MKRETYSKCEENKLYLFFLEITSETEELCEKPEYENKERAVEGDAKASQTYPKVFIRAMYGKLGLILICSLIFHSTYILI